MSQPPVRLREQEPSASRHTLSVLVENKPGVLVRIAGLFSRRGPPDPAGVVAVRG